MTAHPLNRAWRIAATGFCFVMFGLSALMLSVTVFPLFALITRDVRRRSERVQYVLHWGCRIFIQLMRVLGLLRWEVQGRERLAERGRMIVANHPSLIDVVFFLSWMPQADCIMKQALQHNPFLRWTVGWAGYIGNASPEGLIEDCVATLRAGRSLIVFPEGTRSVPGQTAAFKRGAARIALVSGAELLPVRIRCEPITLTKQNAWWQVPAQPPLYRFVVGEPFRAGEPAGETPAAAARRLTAQLQQLLVPPEPGLP
ncbi:MAG: lysophospholipid acyltransferase family protein [Nevskia sp.]